MKVYEILDFETPNDPDTLKSRMEHVDESEANSIAEQHPFGYDYDEESDVYTLFDENGDDAIQLRGDEQHATLH